MPHKKERPRWRVGDGNEGILSKWSAWGTSQKIKFQIFLNYSMRGKGENEGRRKMCSALGVRREIAGSRELGAVNRFRFAIFLICAFGGKLENIPFLIYIISRKEYFFMKIEFYRDASGRVPVEEFLCRLDVKMRVKMLRSVQALQEMGGALRKPLSEALDDGIFELRVKVGTNISRVFYFFVIGNRAILTHGFIKKTQKTPARELERAKKIREEYRKRFGL